MTNSRKFDFVLFLSSDYCSSKALRFIKGLYGFRHRICINSFPAEYNYSSQRLRDYIDLISNTIDAPSISLSANYFIPQEEFRSEDEIPYITILSDPLERICFEFLCYQMMLAHSPFEPVHEDRTRSDIRVFAEELIRNNVTTRLFGQVSIDQEVTENHFQTACERLSRCAFIYKTRVRSEPLADLKQWLTENSISDLPTNTLKDAWKRASSIFVDNDQVSLDIDAVSVFPGLKKKPSERQVRRFVQSLENDTVRYLRAQNAFDTELWNKFG